MLYTYSQEFTLAYQYYYSVCSVNWTYSACMPGSADSCCIALCLAIMKAYVLQEAYMRK